MGVRVRLTRIGSIERALSFAWIALAAPLTACSLTDPALLPADGSAEGALGTGSKDGDSGKADAGDATVDDGGLGDDGAASIEAGETDSSALVEAGPCSPNACGGCVVLTATLGASCGQCGQYACNGQNAVTCQDPGKNACGGCGTLAGTPGGPCGCNSSYTFVCSADKTSVTCTDPGANACGGCGTLSATPGSPCGMCGTETCSADKTSVSCSDPGLNACGGCGALPAAPGAACGTCGAEVCGANKTSVTCSDPGANACGGCGTLSAAPGAACGTCGTQVCSANKTSVSCNDPGTTNSCPTWCTGKTPPSGVAASDYTCVDFDNGSLPSTNGWSKGTGTAGGASMISTAKYESASDSMFASVSGNAQAALAGWTDNASSAFTKFTVSAGVYPSFAGGPTWTGSGTTGPAQSWVNVLCIFAGPNQICLNYTNGGNTEFQSSYVGFYLWTQNGSMEKDCQLTTPPTMNAWNDMQLVGDWGAGSGQLFIGGVSAGAACMTPLMSSTQAQALVGLIGSGTISTFGAYYDDVQVWGNH
jgi:hypothetical protein